MTDMSLVVIVPAALRARAIGLAAAIGYAISLDVPLSADGGASVTHYGLHTAAGPVIRLVLAGEASADPAVVAAAAAAFGSLAAAGQGSGEIATLRAGLLASIRPVDDTWGADHLRAVCAGNGLSLVVASPA